MYVFSPLLHITVEGLSFTPLHFHSSYYPSNIFLNQPLLKTSVSQMFRQKFLKLSLILNKELAFNDFFLDYGYPVFASLTHLQKENFHTVPLVVLAGFQTIQYHSGTCLLQT